MWVDCGLEENGHMEVKMHLMIAMPKVSGLLTVFHEDIGYLKDLKSEWLGEQEVCNVAYSRACHKCQSTREFFLANVYYNFV